MWNIRRRICQASLSARSKESESNGWSLDIIYWLRPYNRSTRNAYICYLVKEYFILFGK